MNLLTFVAPRNQHVQMKPVVDKNNVIRKEKVFVVARTQTKILMDALIVLNVLIVHGDLGQNAKKTQKIKSFSGREKLHKKECVECQYTEWSEDCVNEGNKTVHTRNINETE